MLWRAFGIDIFTAAEWGDNFSTPETNKNNKNNQFSSSRQRQLSSFVIVINKECIHFVDKQTNRCIKTIVRTHFSPWSYVDHAKWFNSLYYLKKRLVRCYSLDGLNFFDKAVRTIFILSHHKDFYSLFLKCFWTFSVFFFVSVCLFFFSLVLKPMRNASQIFFFGIPELWNEWNRTFYKIFNYDKDRMFLLPCLS